MNQSRGKKGNITSAFGSDIILEGMTSVPNLLLKYYSKIGITDSEMMLIIQLIYLRTSNDQQFPSFDVLAEFMSGDRTKIKADLASLIEKGIISINHTYSEDTGGIVSIYSYEPLFEKILELWACEKIEACQRMKKSLLKQQENPKPSCNRSRQSVFARVCKAFEKEFGRPISPMEVEQIGLWLEDNGGDPELVLEALKRAVLRGKQNFKYIDSILLEWQRNRLTTVAEVMEYEASFRERQANRPKRQKTQVNANKHDKFRLLYLG